MTNNRPVRRGRYFFNSMAGAEYLGMSPRIFRRYVRLLDIRPRPMYGRLGKWFTFEDLHRTGEVFAPPAHQYVKYLGKRIDWCLRKKVEIRRIEEKKR